VDAVLGLSVTPAAVGLVLVEGQDADGATMDRDAFEVRSRRQSVFAPAEADLALARGAALASAHTTEFAFADHVQAAGRSRRQDRRRRQLAQTGPLALLVAGVLTFVVSVSVAISLQLAPEKESRTPGARPAANTSPEPPAAVTHGPAAFPPPVAIPAPVAEAALAPPPEAPPVEVAPPPVEAPIEPLPEAPALVSDAPPADLPAAVDPAPLEPGLPAPLPPPPEQIAPPPVAPEPERPGILRRIKDRLSGIGGDDEVQPGETLPPAPPVPLTESPLLPPP
jgi:hypothetical protein